MAQPPRDDDQCQPQTPDTIRDLERRDIPLSERWPTPPRAEAEDELPRPEPILINKSDDDPRGE